MLIEPTELRFEFQSNGATHRRDQNANSRSLVSPILTAAGIAPRALSYRTFSQSKADKAGRAIERLGPWQSTLSIELLLGLGGNQSE